MAGDAASLVFVAKIVAKMHVASLLSRTDPQLQGPWAIQFSWVLLQLLGSGPGSNVPELVFTVRTFSLSC